MDKRIKPWVTKKIVEYIGEEEPTLTDFICQKVVAHSPPQSIQNDVAMVSPTAGPIPIVEPLLFFHFLPFKSLFTNTVLALLLR